MKQEESIQKNQLKLNEINKMRDYLKAINEFKPNESFVKDSFGQLNLNEYSSFDPFKSSILKGQQPKDLIKLCEFDPNQKQKLLYRASQNGFSSNDFHSKCDGHANTLCIFKAKGSEFIFGTFTTAIWDSSFGYESDQNPFVFSLTNKDNKPCKMKKGANNYNYDYSYRSYNDFSFGNGDICIPANANTTNCTSNLGNTFKHPQYAYGTNGAQTFLAGSQTFQLSEIEVYHKV